MRRSYHLVIDGNQDDPKGNPVPFQRVIKQRMRGSAARYLDWTSFVRGELYRQCGTKDVNIKTGRLLTPAGCRIEAAFLVEWANEKHGDLDNVAKGIMDALLDDDRHVMDLAAVAEHRMRGRVHVDIHIDDDASMIKLA